MHTVRSGSIRRGQLVGVAALLVTGAAVLTAEKPGGNMSFLSILKRDAEKVGDVIGVGASLAGPFVSVFNPVAGTALNMLGNLITKAEQTYTAEKQGTAKKQVVIDEFMALWPLVQEVLATQAGERITFDQSQIGPIIDATVAQINAAKIFHDSIKVEKISPPAA